MNDLNGAPRSRHAIPAESPPVYGAPTMAVPLDGSEIRQLPPPYEVPRPIPQPAQYVTYAPPVGGPGSAAPMPLQPPNPYLSQQPVPATYAADAPDAPEITVVQHGNRPARRNNDDELVIAIAICVSGFCCVFPWLLGGIYVNHENPTVKIIARLCLVFFVLAVIIFIAASFL